MGKYTELETDIYSIFASTGWIAYNIKTYPSNYVAVDAPDKFIRINIIPATTGVNLRSVAGILMIDIFTSAGYATKDAFDIADKLDTYLLGKSISIGSGSTQFSASAIQPEGKDKDNPSLYRTTYSIPFNYYGVN
jgi:hypothetical protein